MSTPIRLPDSLPYPITIAQLGVSTGDTVEKGQRLLAYKYWDLVDVITAPGEEEAGKARKQRVDLVGTFDSPVAGTVVSLDVRVGDEFVNSQRPVVEIRQACPHDVTYGGLCVQCGQAVEDEAGAADGVEQAKLTVSHTNTHIRVSERQAASLGQSAQLKLREARKLVLVVDLDQTVIHCGVDPTIGEWSKDPNNPNYEALKDVQSFSLDEEPVLPPFYMGPKPPTRKCWYYVKLRPGLKEFFAKIAPHFELHIYTMATRAYALEIAKIIDPDGKLFGDRILSRDENGSLTQKSLERLFPMDQSMVVVIDDRGDVWNWCENLIKVVPYDFFVGIGDINSNFLPIQQNSMLHLGRRNRKKPKQEEELLTDILDTEKKLKEKINEEVKRQEDQMHRLTDEKLPDTRDIAKKLEHNASLEVQQQNRPLAELQKHMRNERLLFDDDDELPHLGNILLKVHSAYYDQLQRYNSGEDPIPDIKILMPKLKETVFEGCRFVFSGLIPLHTNIERADIVLWTNMFGASTTANLDYNTTHLITRTPGTMKARLAKSFNPAIKIVHPDWIFECLVGWERVEESPYELIVEEPVGEEYLENFKRDLAEAQKKVDPPAQDSRSSLLLLDGNGSWLDYDDDEMDEFLNEESDNEEDTEQMATASKAPRPNGFPSGGERPAAVQSQDKPELPEKESNGKRPYQPDDAVSASKVKLQRTDAFSEEAEEEDEDDLEAELLLELGQ
ncbi:ABL127Wp [Eremothecium gossypii ATCC 10895]|uniref:RNA polymerase II subunit A C-terminal domain phosphatase n=1 Tax=Eremothecium gossypii (strain ATCC 10895 / CBS 109.51 / FGSC 9923 / NRRL Y-1056) TaxID=284811 RepID=Q75E00_EREGS|nr:ABL127Wp [Eremothecium gossypii ATCC 10895]AAS50644.2 ABL127Wp [Eremothecium gossypii ATCC 10895]AEY94932.1 FABL127Wp [Eremothecium gossypii FDAG1]